MKLGFGFDFVAIELKKWLNLLATLFFFQS